VSKLTVTLDTRYGCLFRLKYSHTHIIATHST
jgi:hypothetical protein